MSAVQDYHKARFIYLHAPLEVLAKRHAETDEKDLLVKDYKKHLDMFNTIMEICENRYGIDVYRFDTSLYNQEKLAKQIIKTIEE